MGVLNLLTGLNPPNVEEGINEAQSTWPILCSSSRDAPHVRPISQNS